jgi:energy-coupling factor transporter ATP-binding protein EcfA2
MILTVKNLGPIKKGTIDLNKRLIILTGPNNTGKSYLTYLIHGISQYRELAGIRVARSKIVSLVESLSAIAKQLEEGKDIDLVELANQNVGHLSQIVTSCVQDNLTKIFASKVFNTSIELDIVKFNYNTEPDAVRKLRVIEDVLYTITTDGSIDNTLQDEAFKQYDTISTLANRIAYLFISYGVDQETCERTFFFPAERTAINLFAKHITSTKAEIKDELDSDVIIGMSDEELGRRLRAQVKNAPKYPYAIRDYINFVNNFKRQEEEGPFAKVASRIETLLTGGQIHIDDLDQLSFTPKNSPTPLELHLSSSLVKSLSYLIIYLRHEAKLGDQIIIDEPELNLHPDLQVALARIIAEMVNNGLKVIISTHSDYLIKELNNLILLDKLPKSEDNFGFIEEHHYQPKDLLNSKLIGAYFLCDNTITPINVEEDGIEVPSINDAITSIDSMAQEIFFRLEE